LILPTKRLPEDRALLAIGADILLIAARPKTVSRLWDEIKQLRAGRNIAAPLPFDWFVLSLSLLFALGTVQLRDGRLYKVRR